MKKMMILFLITFVPLFSFSQSLDFQFKTGDVVFQSYAGSQSFAIQLATHSIYNHVGVVIVQEGKPFVFEAVEPVKLTPVTEWAKRGIEGKYVVKRIIGADSLITDTVVGRMLQWMEKNKGKHYDLLFEWTMEKLYCSELVWKIYKDCAGIELGALKSLRDYDLSNPVVQAKLKERYGKSIPLDQKMIAPSDIFSFPLLVTVFGE